jgi:MORN repeat
MYHGRGVYTSCPTTPFNKTTSNKQQQQSVLDTTSDTDNTTASSVVYDGRWEHGYIEGYGTLTIPAIGAGETLQRYKRDWPSVSRYYCNQQLQKIHSIHNNALCYTQLQHLTSSHLHTNFLNTTAADMAVV